jgi:hypothetical protein
MKMENIELMMSVPGQVDPVLVTVPQGARLLEVIEIVRGHEDAGMSDADEIFLFLEEANQPLGVEMRLDECGIGHRHHVHAHRCHAVDVTVAFNGTERTKPFAPTARVGKVKVWAVEAFNVPTEKAEYLLDNEGAYLDDGNYLHALAHHCHLNLDLVSLELTIHYTVNAENQVTHERHQTPRQIIEKAELDSAKYYLNHASISYKDTPDKPILLHEGEAFTAIYSGGGTVS